MQSDVHQCRRGTNPDCSVPVDDHESGENCAVATPTAASKVARKAAISAQFPESFQGQKQSRALPTQRSTPGGYRPERGVQDWTFTHTGAEKSVRLGRNDRITAGC